MHKIFLALILTSCVDTLDTVTDEQDLCRFDPDTCPGHPITLAQRTDDYAVSTARSVGTPVETAEATCSITGDQTQCSAHVGLSDGRWLMSTCSQIGDGDITCSSFVCSATSDGTVCVRPPA